MTLGLSETKMADMDQDDVQDQQQFTGDDLAELHDVARQLQMAGDPRATRVANFIAAQSGGGDGSGGPGFAIQETEPVPSWQEDLENDLWGEAAAQVADSGADTEGERGAEAGVSSTDDSGAQGQGESPAEGQQPPVANDTGDTAPALGEDAKSNEESDSAEGWDLEQGRYTPASADDIANGNYIKVGFRHLIPFPKFPYHSYIHIPVIGQDGKPTFEKWGVLNDEKTGKDQEVRDDHRNSPMDGPAREIYLKVTPEQKEALRARMHYFNETDKDGKFIHPCPVCGPKYHLLTQNSNTFLYNMLFWNPAGMIWAPKPPRWTVKYGENMGEAGWYK